VEQDKEEEEEEQLESYPGEEAVEQDEEEEEDDESHLQDGAAAHHAVGAQAKHLIKEHKPLVGMSNIYKDRKKFIIKIHWAFWAIFDFFPMTTRSSERGTECPLTGYIDWGIDSLGSILFLGSLNVYKYGLWVD